MYGLWHTHDFYRASPVGLLLHRMHLLRAVIGITSILTYTNTRTITYPDLKVHRN